MDGTDIISLGTSIAVAVTVAILKYKESRKEKDYTVQFNKLNDRLTRIKNCLPNESFEADMYEARDQIKSELKDIETSLAILNERVKK